MLNDVDNERFFGEVTVSDQEPRRKSERAARQVRTVRPPIHKKKSLSGKKVKHDLTMTRTIATTLDEKSPSGKVKND